MNTKPGIQARISAPAMRDEWTFVGAGVFAPLEIVSAVARFGLDESCFIDKAAWKAVAYILDHATGDFVDYVDIADAIGEDLALIEFAAENLAQTGREAFSAANRIARQARERKLARACDDVQAEIGSGRPLSPLLCQRLAEAALAADSTKAARMPMISDGRTLATRDIPPPDTIVEGLFETRDKVDIVAPSKCRKSWFTIALAVHIASGRPFIGLCVKSPRRVLYINLEIKDDDFDRRLQTSLTAYGIDADALGDRLGVMHSRSMGPTIRANIIGYATKFGADVVVIDPQYKLLRPEEDENSGNGISEILRLKDQIAEEAGAAVVAVMHDAKGQAGDRDIRDRGAGSSWTARDFDARITLTPHSHDPENMVVVSTMCRNHPPRENFSAEFRDFAFVWTDAPPIPETTKTREAREREAETAQTLARINPIEAAVIRAVTLDGNPTSYRTIASRVTVSENCSEYQVRMAVKRLVKDGEISEISPIRKGYPSTYVKGCVNDSHRCVNDKGGDGVCEGV